MSEFAAAFNLDVHPEHLEKLQDIQAKFEGDMIDRATAQREIRYVLSSVFIGFDDPKKTGRAPEFVSVAFRFAAPIGKRRDEVQFEPSEAVAVA
jgi:hypothetical protein